MDSYHSNSSRFGRDNQPQEYRKQNSSNNYPPYADSSRSNRGGNDRSSYSNSDNSGDYSKNRGGYGDYRSNNQDRGNNPDRGYNRERESSNNDRTGRDSNRGGNDSSAAPSEMEMVPIDNAIFIENLPDVKLLEMAEHFRQFGILKKDRKTDGPKIQIYTDKTTGAPKGEGTVYYDDAHSVSYAIDCLNGSEYMGKVLKVVQATRPNFPNNFMGRGGRGGGFRGRGRGDFGRGRGGGDRGRGGGRGGGDRGRGEGDWMCPNESCGNSNFGWRGSCNRCQTPKEGGGSGGGYEQNRNSSRGSYGSQSYGGSGREERNERSWDDGRNNRRESDNRKPERRDNRELPY